MLRPFWVLGCTLGLLAVALGAFGAHGLRGRVEPPLLDVFETAVRYQMYHSLALLALAGFADRLSPALAPWAGWMFTAGILVFCGSLYLLVLTGTRWLGAVTPIGGLAFLAGWILLALAGARAGT